MKKFIIAYLFFMTVLIFVMQAGNARLVHEWTVDLSLWGQDTNC